MHDGRHRASGGVGIGGDPPADVRRRRRFLDRDDADRRLTAGHLAAPPEPFRFQRLQNKQHRHGEGDGLGKNQPQAAHNRPIVAMVTRDSREKSGCGATNFVTTWTNCWRSERFRDYCPNGLQVEGRAELRRIVCGVTASQALLDEAVRLDADAVLVHHGWFWRGEDGRVAGIRKRRLATLLGHDINLFAYHLPLDAHAEIGNNAQLARRLGWSVEGRFAEQDIGFVGRPAEPTTAAQVAGSLEKLLGRPALLIGAARAPGGPVGLVQRRGPGLVRAGDRRRGPICYISGEISEQTVHLARESGVPYIAAGHHATERYGVMALGEHLRQQFDLDCRFVEVDNPV